VATAPSFDGTQVCLTVNPDTFFPEVPEKPNRDTSGSKYEEELILYKQKVKDYPKEINSAKQICSECQFIQPCLEYALTADVYGVWGGTTEKERKEIRRARKLPTPRSITLITDSFTKQKSPQ
jgi:hypothetical protein